MNPGTFGDRRRRVLDLIDGEMALLAAEHANVRWLTGLAGEPHQLYGMGRLWAVIGPGGEARTVAPASELAWIAERGALESTIPYGQFFLGGHPRLALEAGIATHRTLTAALVAALDAVGAPVAVLTDDGMSPSLLRQLDRELEPRSLLVDPEPWRTARAVKDATEITALRRVNAAAEAGIANAVAHARVGVSELDLLGWVREAMVRHGARPLLGSVGTGERGALVDFSPSQRRLCEGEAIRFDVGCTLDGYHADLARTAVLGDPPPWLKDAHAALLAGEDAMLEAIRPGVSGGELFDRAIAAVRAAGLPDYRRTHCGHGIGLDMYEPPLITPGGPDLLAIGSTCCVETPLYLHGRAGVQIEDAVVVTAGGYDRLGSLPRGLLVAGHVPAHPLAHDV